MRNKVLGLLLSDTYNSLQNAEESKDGIVYQYENSKPMMVAENSAYYGKKDQYFINCRKEVRR